MKYVLIRYGELGLKGKNRYLFENRLCENITLILDKNRVKHELEKAREGILLRHCGKKKVKDLLKKVFGISWFAEGRLLKRDIDEIKKEAVRILKKKKGSFKIEANRSWKAFGYSSMEINKEVGNHVVKELGLRVELKNPDNIVFVDVSSFGAFVFEEKIKGLGGLPVGTSGRALCLLSGGIDSAVAAWYMMKRGCYVDYLHFYALRNANEVLKSKIKKIFDVLKEYCPDARLYVVPYHAFEAVSSGIGKERLVVFRRFMVRLASMFGKKEGYNLIVTGDSLGQVASQTIENLSCVNEASELLIVRPLVGFDKDEIIKKAKEIGTFELAIKEYKDCCSIIERHPRIRADLKKVERIEKKIDLDWALDKSLKEIKELK
jgi:thiamine biosynthesis protein ThiI